MNHGFYSIHPNPAKKHMVCTPDGGIVECKHEAAALRVCSLLNEMLRALRAPNGTPSERIPPDFIP